MRTNRTLCILCTVSLLVLLAPVHAADAPEDMLNRAQNLSLKVPEKGNAVLGSPESMTEMVDWMNACSRALIGFFNDIMNLFGLSNTTYVKDMNKAFEPVLQAPPTISR